MSEKSGASILMDSAELARQIEVLAFGLADLVEEPERTVLVGIRTRGATLAARIHQVLKEKRRLELPLGSLDITLYRDDLSTLAANPLVGKTVLDFNIEGRTVLLVDDVLFTGRTIRSALDELVDFGRPGAIRLGVLVDRGHREFPIQADFASLTIETVLSQVVKVCLQENDGRDEVILTQRALVAAGQPNG